MPIPDFDHNNVIPPHLGNPTEKTHLSPYPCTIFEFCSKFATSKDRIEILKNFIEFRKLVTQNGILNGFQWLDGSFLENIEISDNRSPRDLDLVTFFNGLNLDDQSKIISNFPEFVDPVLSKNKFKLDHYPVDYGYSPDATVEMTRYWIQLFTHNRKSIWKGILRLPLNTPIDDDYALTYLNSL